MGRHLHDHDAGEDLVSVEEARARVLDAIVALPPLQLPLADAYGCVAAEDLVSAVDLPEFASSGMDGFAVRAADVLGASPERPAHLKVVGRARIGIRPDATVSIGEAVQIATGAPIPAGADTIVPIENAEEDSGLVRIFEAALAGRHIRPRAEDVRIGDVLVHAGKRLGAPELGLLGNAGVPHPLVHPRPRVVVISTGDELIPPTEDPTFGQVRDANAYTIYGALREAGAMPVMAGIVHDDPESLKEMVLSHELQADAFVSSGGVSVGERDVVKAAFFRRGDVDFYRVAMQPGMPQGFGQVEGKPFFGLPGNPVSVFVSFELFVRPAILKMMGRTALGRPEIDRDPHRGYPGAEGEDAVRPRARAPWRRRVDRDADRRPRLEPDRLGRAGERLGDRPGRDRGRGRRLARHGHALPFLGGLRMARDQAGADGRTRIVEVGAKPETERVATAEAWLLSTPEAVAQLVEGTAKGSPIESAKLAAVTGVKRTPDLLPHCHPIRVTGAEALVEPDAGAGRIRVEVTVRAVDRTGVEMEALTAAAVGALSLYDTAKAFDRAARIDGVRLLAKSGGASGEYRADR